MHIIFQPLMHFSKRYFCILHHRYFVSWLTTFVQKNCILFYSYHLCQEPDEFFIGLSFFWSSCDRNPYKLFIYLNHFACFTIRLSLYDDSESLGSWHQTFGHILLFYLLYHLSFFLSLHILIINQKTEDEEIPTSMASSLK